jgi:hypothetical protein
MDEDVEDGTEPFGEGYSWVKTSSSVRELRQERYW